MKLYIKFLKINKKCFVNVYIPEKDDLQYKIEGLAEILSSGEEIKSARKSVKRLVSDFWSFHYIFFLQKLFHAF